MIFVCNTFCYLMLINHDINHLALTQNQKGLYYRLLSFDHTGKNHEIINRSRANPGFTRATKELYQSDGLQTLEVYPLLYFSKICFKKTTTNRPQEKYTDFRKHLKENIAIDI